MFVDDTNLWDKIAENSDSTRNPHDLDCLSEWSEKWLLKFNPAKGKIMHVGHYINTTYFIKNEKNKVEIQMVTDEKDL